MALGTTSEQRVGTSGRLFRAPVELVDSQRKYLPEVQGLRALAVLMVVSYHVWFGRVSGGVDIFLLVSAFLLTGQFVRKLEAGRPLALINYWVHLFKRLLPLITLTLLATLGATYLFIPKSAWSSIFEQTWASLFYYQNWYLAAESVDYYAADHSLASPLQHFWSLSIQGQIFILWPLLFALAAVIARLGRLPVRPLLMLMFGLIFVASLWFSVVTTNTNQAFAYFDTRARLWEFALGSLLALALPYLRFGRGTRIALGWFGMVAMLSCGFILQVGQQFPGYMALWPTLAAACIITAGFTDSRFGADRLLSWKPLVKLGDSSYALYLVHWPILILYLSTTGHQSASLQAGLVIIVLSLGAAWLATTFIDAPLRRSSWIDFNRRRAVAVILVCVSVVAVPLSGWQVAVKAQEQAVLAQAAKNNPGAASLAQDFVSLAAQDAPLVPSATAMAGEWPAFAGGCAADPAEEFINRCSNGIQDGVKSIVVLGSSHAHVLNTPVQAIAEANHWSLTSITKGHCPLGEDIGAEITASCVDFNVATMGEVLAMKPDLIITTSTRTNADPEIPERLDPSWVDVVRTYNDAGIEVLAVRDNPRLPQTVTNCLDQPRQGFAACDAKRAELFVTDSPTDAVAWELPDTKFLDFTDYFCGPTDCPAVIGNVIVYKDDTHVSRSYMETLTPFFEQQFRAVTGWDMI